LSTGATAGIAIGVTVAIAAGASVGAIVFLRMRKRRLGGGEGGSWTVQNSPMALPLTASPSRA
jgi:hypothetical protein